MKLIVFTDLDGTLLDHGNYSWRAAAPALDGLKRAGAPLILCSSKTRAEMLPLQKELGVNGPLITENGGGIFAPKDHAVTRSGDWEPLDENWSVWRIGMSIDELRRRFGGFKGRYKARGFGDMSDAEVAQLTGLSLERAALARRREFNEPLILPDAEKREAEFRRAALDAGLQLTKGGRFYHLLGGGDKGRAVELLCGLFRLRQPGLLSVALGDAPNDASMLAAVDRPFLVARHDGGHSRIELPGLCKMEGIGPAGWNQAVLNTLKELG